MYALIFKTGGLIVSLKRILIQFFLIDRVIQEEGLYVFNMQNILEKHFSISIALVRRRGRSLVYYNNIPKS
jgi:hypothetical protein